MFYQVSYLKAKEMLDEMRRLVFLDDNMVEFNPHYQPYIAQIRLLKKACIHTLKLYTGRYYEFISTLENVMKKLPTDVIVFGIMEYLDIVRPPELRITYNKK